MSVAVDHTTFMCDTSRTTSSLLMIDASLLMSEEMPLEANAQLMVDFVPNNSTGSLQITLHKVNGKNYLEWSQTMQLAIERKGKLGYLNGEIKSPTTKDPRFDQWRSQNSIVIMIGKSFIFLPTAQDVREVVRETYSDLDNYSQLFELNARLWKMEQGDHEVTTYYNDMMIVWLELDQFEEDWENPSNSARYKKIEEAGYLCFWRV
ncbi:hypothetical protein ZIOFF_006133 [Zingiber officinale]|uniref:Retrotransposon Copia-like N-terminal domain-containing protein n=1 Tax=Zingiber officinale TaxID=94328 RepID=A0A8J5HNC9_ZINOF|nr:hypothetical protein ZIOFF_006133 [Zingiber officinale]